MNVKIFTKNIESEARDQVMRLASLSAFESSKIRIMPDVHAGKGCVVGFTADLGNKVIPNIVGSDIGCGMLAVSFGQQHVDLQLFDEVVHKVVPAGRNVHKDLQSFDFFNLLCYNKLKGVDWLNRSLGTLGSGNHFIELDQSKNGEVWMIIHTGSRNLGAQVAKIYQDLAVDYCAHRANYSAESEALIAKLKAEGRQAEIQQALRALKQDFAQRQPQIPAEFCYLEGELREAYLHDMKICQNFAALNRERIASAIVDAYTSSGKYLFPIHSFHTVHNYISFEDNIVRKGAISAQKGEPLIIPLNMRDGCIYGVGLGNEEWNNSAPHGAGRAMSRGEARKTIKLEDFQDSMSSVYSTTVNKATLDEAPFAYKPSQEIVDLVKDTVDIIDILCPIYNFKGSD